MNKQKELRVVITVSMAKREVTYQPSCYYQYSEGAANLAQFWFYTGFMDSR